MEGISGREGIINPLSPPSDAAVPKMLGYEIYAIHHVLDFIMLLEF